MNTISAGSFSRLSVYSECPQRAKLAYVDKVKEAERPLPPSKEHANDRGSRIHTAAEDYVQGNRDDLAHELLNFKDEIEHLRDLYQEGCVLIEQDWAFDELWDVCDPQDRDSIFLRAKLDALVFLTDTDVVAVDHKTGKRVNNEVKHAQQGQLYMLATFFRYPEVQTVTVEFWYLDQDEMYQVTYTREQGLKFFSTWNRKMVTMLSDTDFTAKPSTWTCRFCPYQTGKNKWIQGTGHCSLNP